MFRRSILTSLLAAAAVLCACSEASAFGKRRARTQCAPPAYAYQCLPTSPRAAVYCTGTCKDDYSVAAYGYGDDYGKAQTDANGKIALQCALRGGVKSYDTCTPLFTGHASPCRTYAITESGNPAPGSGWYVEILVLSTGRTWYYGPYASYNDAYFVFDQLNDYPANQWVALPQYLTAGTILQPW